MGERATDEDQELLDELGIDTAPEPTGGRTAREQRILAGFEEVERFVEKHGRLPEHGEGRDIFERLYAVRLDRIRASEECRESLKGLDPQGLLDSKGPSRSSEVAEVVSDEDLLASLGAEDAVELEVTKLIHVRSRDEIRAAEEIARRTPCKDFDLFHPVFNQVQRELETGGRRTVKYKEYAEFKKGDLFILDGQKGHRRGRRGAVRRGVRPPGPAAAGRVRQRNRERPSAAIAAACFVQGQVQSPHHGIG